MRCGAAAILLLGMLSGFTGASPAQAGALPRGTVELSAYLLYDHSSYNFAGIDDGSSADFSLTTSLGYCVSNVVEVFGGLMWQYSSTDYVGMASTSATAVGPQAGLTFNFPTHSNIVPYFTTAFGFVSFSGNPAYDATGWTAPFLGGGIRVLVGNSASVNLGLAYIHSLNALGIQDEHADSFEVTVGISAFLNKPSGSRRGY